MTGETTHISGFDPATATLFLDFDGTLVDLAEQPDAIIVPPDLGALLNTLRTRLNGRLALVTGRAIEDLRRYVPDFEGAIYASHGACLWADGRLVDLVQTPENLIELSDDARALCKDHPALRFEGKPTGFAVHFRQAPALAATVQATLDKIVATTDGLQVQPAKMAFEVKAGGANKGAAVQDAVTRFGWGDATPWMIGDDVTDEAAFERVAHLGGFGVKVGEGDTVAVCRMTAPADVLAFLRSP